MKLRLTITYFLNLIDLIATLYLVSLFGLDIEANPIGRWLIKTNLVYFVKIVVVGLILYVVSKSRIGNICSWVLLIAFVLLTVYHLVVFVWLKCNYI